ncbi:MAG: hypothetical protein ACK6AD_07135 [Cyanobacteriota bacterium]
MPASLPAPHLATEAEHAHGACHLVRQRLRLPRPEEPTAGHGLRVRTLASRGGRS